MASLGMGQLGTERAEDDNWKNFGDVEIDEGETDQADGLLDFVTKL